MSDWFVGDSAARAGTAGYIYSSSMGTLSGTASAHQLPAEWALLNPATPFDADFVVAYLGPRTRNVSSIQQFTNIARGTAGSETVFLANLTQASSTALQVATYCFPFSIPARTRLTAKVQSSSTTDTGGVSLTLLSSGFGTTPSYQRMSTHGATTTTTRGAIIDGGATANKKGAWTQVVASTPNVAKALILALTTGVALHGSANYLVDIGMGPAGSEVVLIPNLPFSICSGPANCNPPTSGPWTVNIRAASRLAVRLQTTTTDATDRTLDCIIYTLD